MDPREGRFVLHGHLRDGGPIIEGTLAAGVVNKVVVDAMGAFLAKPHAEVRLRHGPLVLRLTVGRAGEVESCHVIVDRVVRSDHGSDAAWNGFVDGLVTTLRVLKFPPSGGITTLVQPILFGGPLK